MIQHKISYQLWFCKDYINDRISDDNRGPLVPEMYNIRLLDLYPFDALENTQTLVWWIMSWAKIRGI